MIIYLPPGHPGFEAGRSGFDLSQRHEPALVVSPTTTGEVRAAVTHAHDHGLDLAVQATGHGLARPLRGGLLIDTSQLTRVLVDPVARSARVSAGATWADVLSAVTPYGLAPLCGSAPAVGAVGYLLGGGLGPLGRRFGFAADRVQSIDLVTVDGKPVTASPTTETELFWGLRGAGTNFGVVTGATIDLVPVSTVYGGGLFFPGEHARSVLAAFHEITTSAPDSLSLSVAFLTFPAVPAVPQPLRGEFVAHVRVCHVGHRNHPDPYTAEALLRPLRRAGSTLLDTVGVLPFSQISSLHADPVTPMAVNCRSVVLRTFEAATVDTIGDVVDTRPAFLIELRHLAGALSRPPVVPNAVGHRHGVINVFTSAFPGQEPATAGRHQEDFLAQLTPWSDGGALPNFLQGSAVTADDVRRAYDHHTWTRLTALKNAWDPANRLRHNHNIPPDTQPDLRP